MAKDLDEQMIEQIKKMQKKIEELEKGGNKKDIEDLQTAVNDLKAELANYKESRKRNVDFGDWE